MNTRKVAILLACFTVVLGIGQSNSVKQFIGMGRNEIHSQDVIQWLSDNKEEDPLYQEIKDKAIHTRIEPINAKIDRIWKAIPGYNGLEVDIDETYKHAKAKENGSSITYVFRQLHPKVGLHDLEVQPIYRGNPLKPMVSLMINVAWGNEYIIPMLNTLDQENVKATFFFDGKWLNSNVELAKEIQKRGHELSNHAYSHLNMSQLSEEKAISEISKTQKLLKDELDQEPKWFAPPSGDFDSDTVRIAKGQGMYTVLWTLDTVDWRKPSPQSIVNKISEKVEPGFLILMHPTSSSSEALQGMIQAIKAKGLYLGTVSQTLSTERIVEPVVE
ncbi:polysaccharide deacetylase family protein [Paenibacillus sp. FA6]|uniref:polysaccharide deacetylase family protein n=1 Tax=Paenibacillus sp. FA6 TaxID=3413029 RepID=UPI003F65E75E